MYLIVGLGNPGDKYRYTKHNAGFMVLIILLLSTHISINRIKHKAVLGEGLIGKRRLCLQSPRHI